MSDSPDTNSQDQIDSSDWPVKELAFPAGAREPRFQVVFKQSALDEIHLHGQGAKKVEVCGVLVGQCCCDAQGPYLLVEHCIRGSAAESNSTNVTFTAQTWQHIQEAMDRQYADKKMVGWYHTHPGFGIFLSEMDRFICNNFFNLPWQVAFVYDPQSGEEGNFIWRGGKPEVDTMLIENDVTPLAAAIPLISKREAKAAGVDEWRGDVTTARLAKLELQVNKLQRRQQMLIIAFAFLAAFVAFWSIESAAPGPAPMPAKTGSPSGSSSMFESPGK